MTMATTTKTIIIRQGGQIVSTVSYQSSSVSMVLPRLNVAASRTTLVSKASSSSSFRCLHSNVVRNGAKPLHYLQTVLIQGRRWLSSKAQLRQQNVFQVLQPARNKRLLTISTAEHSSTTYNNAHITSLLRRRKGLVLSASLLIVATVIEGNAEGWWLLPLQLDNSHPANSEKINNSKVTRNVHNHINDDDDEILSLPRQYDREAIQNYWKQRPISILLRVGQVLYELGPIALRYWGYQHSPFAFTVYNANKKKNTTKGTDNDINNDTTSTEQQSLLDVELNEQFIRQMSKDFKESLTNLGPAWIKAGQQLAIRPDLIHPILLKELQTLCDSVRTTMSEEEAMDILRNELGSKIVQEHQIQSLQLVASASLGQVYKAQIRTTEGEKDKKNKNKNNSTGKQWVAIKIQRPGMLKSFSLDLYLLQLYGNLVDAFTSTFTKQPPYHKALFDTFSLGSYSELDYENEAQNQLLFQRELQARKSLTKRVKIPNVHLDMTTRRVLTTEWIDGVPLATSSTETIQRLIPVGVELFLTQLLDIGTFHSDPHPGNILVTSDEGILCLLDFGLCASVNNQERQAMTKALVHLLYRDFDTLVTYDTKELGFLPQEFDTEPLKPILVKVLTGGLLEAGSNMSARKRKFMEISSELNEIFFQYPFQVPPFFALVTRGLGLLEGIALTGDPNFDIFKASLPFVASKRAVSLILSGRNEHKSSIDPNSIDEEQKETISLKRLNKRFFGWMVSKWRARDTSNDLANEK